METLREGTRGLHVRRWQSFLVDRGFLSAPTDGDFGRPTRIATAAFQRANGLVADGVVGPRTAAAADWLADEPPIENLAQWLVETPEPATDPSVPDASPPVCDGKATLTEAMLRRIMPRIRPASCGAYAPFLQKAMEEFTIDTPPRAAAFLAQLAHESGQLRFMEEIWGPTPAQRRYEPPTRLAASLGNTEPGDGKRFKGRGPIQLTGRANYRRYGKFLGVDLVAGPELAATKEVGFRVAGLFWKQNGLNELADAQRFEAITRRINGGFNGLADRISFYERAKAVFQVPSIRAFEPREPAVPLRFPRGLDAPGEITPTAAERSPRRGTGRAGRRAAAPPRKKTAKAGKTRVSRPVDRRAGARAAARKARKKPARR